MTSITLTVLLQASVLAASPQGDQYSQAFQQSAQTGQPLMVLVGADWCPACVTMKSSVMPEVRRRGILRKVAFALVNSDRQNRLAGQLMSGEGIPQLIMYYHTTDGWKRTQVNGSVSAESVEKLVQQGIERSAPVPVKPVSTPVRPRAEE